jgi:hypothetical protein
MEVKVMEVKVMEVKVIIEEDLKVKVTMEEDLSIVHIHDAVSDALARIALITSVLTVATTAVVDGKSYILLLSFSLLLYLFVNYLLNFTLDVVATVVHHHLVAATIGGSITHLRHHHGLTTAVVPSAGGVMVLFA